MNDILSQEEIDLLLKSTSNEPEEELSNGLVSINDLIIEEIKDNFILLKYEEDKIDNSRLVDFEGTNYVISFLPYKNKKSVLLIESFASQSINKMIFDNIELYDEIETETNSAMSDLFEHTLKEAGKKFDLEFFEDIIISNLSSTSTNSVFSSLMNLSDIGKFIKITYIFKIYDFRTEIVHILPELKETEVKTDNIKENQDEQHEGLTLEDIIGDDEELYNLQEEVNDSEEYNEADTYFDQFDDDNSNLSLIRDVPLEISVELGRTKKNIGQVLKLSSGEVLELDKLSGEPLDILVNGKVVAKGEVVVIDENFGIKILDIKNS